MKWHSRGGQFVEERGRRILKGGAIVWVGPQVHCAYMA